ncbi:MAG: oligosaccharide flippase family protein [Verrucomicrobiae bacterium]|nr:oligosaccharide flippase family protein [Verrucomicrobiae bacterium]
MRARSFLSASLLLLTLNNVGAALGYVFQGLMARTLSTADFGLMNSLFALGGLLALPAGVYASLLQRQWAERTNAGRAAEADRAWRALLAAASAACAAGAVVALALTTLFAWWLRTNNFTAVIVTIVATACGMAFSFATPLATARQWFGALGVASALGGLLRLALAWLGIHLGTPLSGAIAATAAGGGVLALIAWVRAGRTPWRELPFRELLPARREWIAPALAAVTLWLLCGADLFVIRRVREPHAAGVFAQVLVLARIIFFLIGPMTAVIFPKAATALATPSARPRLVRHALALGALVLIPAATLLAWQAPFAIALLRGSSDPEAVALLRLAAWCLLPLSLCQLVIPALFARRQERVLLEFTLLAGLLPLGLAIFRADLRQAFLVEGAVGLLLLAFAALRLRPKAEAGTESSARSMQALDSPEPAS